MTPSVKPGRWWVLVLLVSLLAMLGGCGIDRFDAKGWAGLAVDGGALFITRD